MTKYEPILRHSVDAFQLTGRNCFDEPGWPDWMRRAATLPMNFVGAVWRLGRTKGQLTVRTVIGVSLVDFDHWIMRDVDGHLRVFTDEQFRAAYRAVEGKNG